MIRAFQKKAAEAEKRLDETLERMVHIYNITVEEAHAKLIENRERIL